MAVKQQLTLEELVNLFVGYTRDSKKRKPDTVKGYKHHLNQFVKFDGGKTPIGKIDTLTIDKYRSYLNEQGLADETINSYVRAVRVMLKYAFKRRLIKELPFFELIEIDPKDRKPKPALRSGDLEKLLAAAQEEQTELLQLRARAIIAVFFASGIRISELCKAELQDFEPFTLDGEEWQIMTVESAKSQPERVVALRPQVWAEVKRYRAALVASLQPGQTEPASLFVIEEELTPITRRGLQHAIARLQKRAGVKISAHKFRRTFAKEWLWNSEGKERDMLKKIGGWETDWIIERYYAGYEPETIIRATRRNGPKWDFGNMEKGGNNS